MKGFTKVIKRTPHMVTSKAGFSKKSSDPEFDDYNAHFSALEKSTEKLLKDTKVYNDAVTSLLTGANGFANHFCSIYSPLQGELTTGSNYPDAAATIANTSPYAQHLDELRSAVAPELELIESRVVGPVKEFQGVLKVIRKTITKRDHKLIDYDRFNNSLTKLRDKKEKSLSDEKNLFKLEQDFEVATNEYDYINNTLKQDLSRFMQLATQFIDPLFHSFYYMQSSPDYENKRTEAWSQIEDLGITKRIVSTSKLVQAKRAEGGLSAPIGRTPSAATSSSSTSFASRSLAPPAYGSSSFVKKATPPPPGQPIAPPPPYSASNNANGIAVGTKRPPPPPPLKPKPKSEPLVEYVTALYDFDAQAEGDLSFKTGDRIEMVKKSESQEDWWTGRLNGVEGVFPGNYVQC
ncbi:hypothetical protein JVU11DRAFT_5496 [Chiua virens]|nr:hypothetical protein JVU11DRAFT_5496 [Chiua virens]